MLSATPTLLKYETLSGPQCPHPTHMAPPANIPEGFPSKCHSWKGKRPAEGEGSSRDPLGIRAAAHRASAQGHRTAPNSCLGETFLSPWLGGSMEESWAPESWPCCLNESGVQRGREFLPSFISRWEKEFTPILRSSADTV